MNLQCICKSFLIPSLSFYVVQIDNMDALFEAQFSPVADSGRALSKCGKCLRYMKYISSQPSRMYCNTCEEVYYLPQKGTIKVCVSPCHYSQVSLSPLPRKELVIRYLVRRFLRNLDFWPLLWLIGNN